MFRMLNVSDPPPDRTLAVLAMVLVCAAVAGIIAATSADAAAARRWPDFGGDPPREWPRLSPIRGT